LTRRLKAALFRFLGYRALHLQNLRSALASFQKATEQQPENPNFTIQTAWCLYRLGNYESAIEKYDQVLQKDAGCATAHAYRALSLARVNRLREAVESLQRARRMGFPVKGEKRRAFWEGTLGTWLAELGNHVEDIEPLRRSIELDPDDANTHYTLGLAYGELNRREESMKELQESIRLDPTQPEAHYALGVCFGEARQLERALDSYHQAIRLRPDYADAHFNLGCTYGEIGRPGDELGEYKTVVEIAPDDRKALINLAIAYSQAGQGEAAVETWKRVIELEPNETEGYASLANEFERLGRFQDALGAAIHGTAGAGSPSIVR
jgi:tetratricopeptide (TPR) repeat protein